MRAHLDGDDLHACRVPPLPLPPLDAHRAEAEQADRPVAFAHLHAVEDLGVRALVGVVRVDPALARQRHVERCTRSKTIRAVVAPAYGRLGVSLDFVMLVLSAVVPVGALRVRCQYLMI